MSTPVLVVACAIVLAAHGLAHLVGFVAAWRLAELPGLPHRTTVLAGRIDLGDAGIRLAGVGWLLLAVAFGAGAVALLLGWPWWRPHVLWTAVLSLVACVLGWPDTRLGIPVNAAVLGVLLLTGPGAAA